MPKRLMHLRHPKGFDSERFEQFKAGCRLFQAHVDVVLAAWRQLPPNPRALIGTYVFGEPSLSAECLVATLPIDGSSTLGSRHELENMSSHLLHGFLPVEFRRDLEEGLEENVTGQWLTNWRRVGEPLERLVALTEQLAQGAVNVALTHDEALVLFDWLAGSQPEHTQQPEFPVQRVLWGIEAVLEKSLPVVLAPDYAAQLAEARRRLSEPADE